MIFNVIPLFGWITLSSGEPFELITQRSTYNPCIDGSRHRNPGDTTTSETCPYAFYTTEVLPCNQYTLNLTVMSNQAMQINEFDFLPCQPDGQRDRRGKETDLGCGRDRRRRSRRASRPPRSRQPRVLYSPTPPPPPPAYGLPPISVITTPIITIIILDLLLAFQNLAPPTWPSAQAEHTPLRGVPHPRFIFVARGSFR